MYDKLKTIRRNEIIFRRFMYKHQKVQNYLIWNASATWYGRKLKICLLKLKYNLFPYVFYFLPQSITGGPVGCSAFGSVSHGFAQFSAASFLPSSSHIGIPVHLSKAHIAVLLNTTLLVSPACVWGWGWPPWGWPDLNEN